MGAVASMALSCVFGTVLLLSMASGAGVYRRVEERMERSAEERIGLTYITAKFHASDEVGGIRAGTFGGGDAMFLPEDIDGIPYETILYVYDGALRELFCEQGWEPGPEAGQAVAEAQELRVAETAPGFFRLQYTSGDGHVFTADVWMRSGGMKSGGMDSGAAMENGGAA